MDIHLNPELFSKYRERAEQLDYRNIDPGLRVTIRLLNKLPGVTTVWCCSSHPDEDDPEGYIALVSEAGRTQALDMLLGAVLEELAPYESYRKAAINISLEWLDCQIKPEERIGNWMLRWHSVDLKDRDDLLRKLEKLVSGIINI